MVSYYQEFHPKAKPGAKERTKIAARLKDGYSVDDIKAAIDGCHRSPHHCGMNERNAKYQTLELIVRDASKVQQFMDVPDGPLVSPRTIGNAAAVHGFLGGNDEQER